mgnify:CR=1 FL=1
MAILYLIFCFPRFEKVWQRLEQYFTCSQLSAHLRRQTKFLLHTLQVLNRKFFFFLYARS